jgi:S1-C subfamily serine protease
MRTLSRRQLATATVTALAVIAVLAGLAASLLVPPAQAIATLPARSRPVPSASSASQARAASVASPEAPVLVYQENAASVVSITSLALVRTLFGTEQSQGIGSGFVIDTDGRIVTNNHGVQAADQLVVTFQDGTTTPAALLGRDPDNDLAVIAVDPATADDSGVPTARKLRPVTLGDSDAVRIGQQAIAIGSPMGLQQTVTAGIVSARRYPGEQSTDELDLLGGGLQTDAAINPGNSGGPLFNADGQVIGINSSIISQSGGYEGIGFAIPINVAKRVVPDLIRQGHYDHPMLGVTTISLSLIGQAAKQQLGLPANQRGLLVQTVTGGAAQAGVRAGSRTAQLNGVRVSVGGDVIVALDGQPVATAGQLRGYIENVKRPGDTVSVSVLRAGQRNDFAVTLGERPPQ